MKASEHILIGIALTALSACSTQEIKPESQALSSPDQAPTLIDYSALVSSQNPPVTLNKGGKTLSLVRVMDGGACKNDYQGARGTFLLYADPDDVERIKSEKGQQIFSEFELKIQNFSTVAIQEAINATNLAEDPFALGADEAQEKLAKQLFNHFRHSVAKAVYEFDQKTTLTVDVIPYPRSFVFYQQGCDSAHLEPEANEANPEP